ncbi:hypothetical protein DH2020_024880 [Rehmannia glutinosa]|uniref:Ent-copalyl diphosphate synthase n=1 Tax=Rehmannia glutinosa TaxID=99300 RepID=A0ABR0W4Z4_REHGL
MPLVISQPTAALQLRSSTAHGGPSVVSNVPAANPLCRFAAGFFPSFKPITYSSSLQCSAISRSRTEGISFIKENIHKLEDENEEHMPIGFEVALPSLIEIAKKLDIDIPNDSKGLQEIYAKRELKLTSLEGMPGLMWQKLLKLQSSDGSFLFSPSSTAFALHQTKDDNCLKYLANHPEIEECVDYVHRYWTNKGICWARNSPVQDIDDTAMGFRLMRLHGYDIFADVFKHFEKGGEFFCFAGQSTQAVTGMYNLYRASQLKFPGEKILEDAGKFSGRFLQEKRANNELLDKWIITKDLPGEVGYALDVPWYASLPRVETRFYLEQYGGEDDVWIGKTLYRWYRNCSLGEFGLSERSLLLAYYLAAASVFEPEKSEERLAWAKTAILVETIVSHFDRQQLSREQKHAFVKEFEHGSILKYANGGRYKTRSSLVGTLLKTLNQLSLDILLAHGRDIHPQLNHAWHKWLKTWEEGGEIGQSDAKLFVRMLNLCGGGKKGSIWVPSEELISSHPKYEQLLNATINVCNQLRLFRHRKVHDSNGCMTNRGCITTVEIESEMQELVKLVITKSDGDLDSSTKQNFLTVARSFYYAAYFSPGTINYHIAKVLFEKVL